jgi:hypothetical protein
MTRKDWIWITLVIAVVHGVVTILLMPTSMDILFHRFDGNPYESPSDPILAGLYFLLNIPYYILSALAGPFRNLPGTYFLIYIGNSLVWGLLGAWLISKLPFMRNQDNP